ncbi:interleukin-4 receptor subunit alpha isoform X1 [Zalophus californianus]|uniref:Interleukin-4 receptor subunit alpha n=1 Tax=Zalophus californianus TaxID=9704 RepID=A0A6J2EFG4_ZALCA|nr:interleukin-4 receptor subunit alpha isoform X1 [Zalophus californianus]XP_027467011.1 interleukin-4 receptor subunit alpha isoform X1 [Zalophus californianus]XP_027467012.1 interleukin-4 receptor subunit alpha isoform X1 [Zalophus californianus]XP_027467013.1 interleukin-4 receptor subunit alpha isoform X1 [Zalophus californianus]XP_027467014.1 interleukin-4 receptor subunit alpha isoform X1 [Zalophus californianus]
MGQLCSGLTFPVSCLILVWVTGSGSVKVLQEPSCLSDYISTSVCQWEMDSPTDCSAELRLSYQLDFMGSENRTCVPENREGAVCTCSMPIDDVVEADVYQLDLWAGKQQLWGGSFQPSAHVKPRTPGNLTVHPNVSHTWLLMWTNPYPSENHLYSELTYMVNISNENDPTDFKVYNVTYVGPALRVAASTLKSGASYSARVRAWAQSYNSTWSEWSPSTTWLNHYEPWEQHLPLSISISCLVILAICLSCYISIIKIKKGWWDQIPNPAHSPLVAIVIQDSQVSLWGKRSRGQEPAKCPHWKTCLTKLLPCLLEHSMDTDEDSSKTARNAPFQAPGKSAWCPVEVSKMILWPESISVVQRVELLEAPVENEEEEEMEEDKRSFCPSPEGSGGSFQEGREDIAARLTESLFLDLLGGEPGGFCPQGLEESCLPPLGSECPQMPWAEFLGAGPQPLHPKSTPWASPTPRPASPAFMEMPPVVTDNPAYRSFGSLLSQSAAPGEGDCHPEPAERPGEADPGIPSAPRPEPESWEQILRQSVLQHREAPVPGPGPSSGYREFMCAVQQACAPDAGVAGFGPSGEAGYKAFSSLLPGTSGDEASHGEGGYKPFQSLTPGGPGAPAPIPLFTFGLDVEPAHSPRALVLAGSAPGHLDVEPAGKEGDSHKTLLAPEQATDTLRDDLAGSIVYSALTCHLCGHLKQWHSQEERGKAHVVPSPCCGCCRDQSSPLVSPLRAPDTLPGGAPLEASLSPASLAPLGISEEGKPSLSFQPAPSNAQSSSQTPTEMAMLSTEPTCISAS